MLKKYPQKYFKELVNKGAASSLDNWSFEKIDNFIKTHNLKKIGYSSGIYGLNGCLIQDELTNKLYAVTQRNTTLFMLF